VFPEVIPYAKWNFEFPTLEFSNVAIEPVCIPKGFIHKFDTSMRPPLYDRPSKTDTQPTAIQPVCATPKSDFTRLPLCARAPNMPNYMETLSVPPYLPYVPSSYFRSSESDPIRSTRPKTHKPNPKTKTPLHNTPKPNPETGAPVPEDQTSLTGRHVIINVNDKNIGLIDGSDTVKFIDYITGTVLSSHNLGPGPISLRNVSTDTIIGVCDTIFYDRWDPNRNHHRPIIIWETNPPYHRPIPRW
jgi:hypothetical protein